MEKMLFSSLFFFCCFSFSNLVDVVAAIDALPLQALLLLCTVSVRGMLFVTQIFIFKPVERERGIEKKKVYKHIAGQRKVVGCRNPF